jgi:hypothetical protein
MGKLKKNVGLLLCKRKSVKMQLKSVSTLNKSNLPNKSLRIKGRLLTNQANTGKELEAMTMKK